MHREGTRTTQRLPKQKHREQNHVQVKVGFGWGLEEREATVPSNGLRNSLPKCKILQNYKLFGTKDCASGLKMRLHISCVSSVP